MLKILFQTYLRKIFFIPESASVMSLKYPESSSHNQDSSEYPEFDFFYCLGENIASRHGNRTKPRGLITMKTNLPKSSAGSRPP